MSAYADLIKLALALLVAAGMALWGRSCGKAAGLDQGSSERAQLERAVELAALDLSNCAAQVGLANNIADQASAEALRQDAIAREAEHRAAQEAATTALRIADLTRQLQVARRNPDAAAQLDMVLHSSIPLR